MDTIASEPKTRRCRRNHSAEFKAQAVAACRQPGVSIAAIALANGINANLLRQWVVAAERGDSRGLTPATKPSHASPTFVPVQVAASPVREDIRIELRRGSTTIAVTWPSTAAVQCAAWMRELLR